MIRGIAAITLCLVCAAIVTAADLQLEIKTEADSFSRFDVDQLEAIGMQEIHTETPWHEGVVTFSGPLMRDVLKEASFTHPTVKAQALNDYSAIIPYFDFEEFDVIIATRLDGKRLSVRDRGPFWIIYPFSERDLMNGDYFSRSVWQLNMIEKASPTSN